MKRTGEVLEIQDGQLRVLFERPEACRSCNACSGARHNTLVSVQGDARVGDVVEVEMPDAKVVKVSAVAYLTPLAGLLAGLFLGYWLSGGRDLPTVLSGLAGVAAAWLLLRVADRRLRNRREWTPRVVRVVASGKETENE